MQAKSHLVGICVCLVRSLRISMHSNVLPPESPITLVLVITVIFGDDVTRSTRYCDRVSFNASPRTTIVTCLAYFKKFSAASADEFPPPTTITCSPVHDTASLDPAP